MPYFKVEGYCEDLGYVKAKNKADAELEFEHHTGHIFEYYEVTKVTKREFDEITSVFSCPECGWDIYKEG